MKHIAILAGLTLALILVAVEGAAADCVATNCAIDAQQRATAPAQNSTEGATKLENAMKELSSATERALTAPKSPSPGEQPAR
jgi:hypothetical protein